ncbi:MAG: hypothetical protein GY851_23980 [bacterium]|nr:hypothetical protein [bacterium]
MNRPMVSMKKLGDDTLLGRDLFFLSIDQAGDLPSDFTVPSASFRF